ncbi:hypothetical protein BRC70_07370, partial [Halobacteriales archaeon QH_6_68_27]
QLQDLRERVESTSDQIESMDRELAEQRAIVEALAAEQGVDVDEVVASVHADEADETEETADADETETDTHAEATDAGEGVTGDGEDLTGDAA